MFGGWALCATTVCGLNLLSETLDVVYSRENIALDQQEEVN